jgi:putative flippase GtrA
VTSVRAQYERFGQLIGEFAKFGVVGVAGLFITNAVYDLLFLHLGVGPVTSTTAATIAAMFGTYLGNRYWSFRTRERTGVARELVIFAALNGIGVLIQDAAVAFNYYLLHLGHNKLAGFAALNLGIALATLFRFWSYRQFVWAAPPEGIDRRGHATGWPGPEAGDLSATPTDEGGRSHDRRGQRTSLAGRRRRWQTSLHCGQSHPLGLVPGRGRRGMLPRRRPALPGLTGGWSWPAAWCSPC